MKKLFCFLLTIFLLAGCQAESEPAIAPSIPTPAQMGSAWDKSGTLLQIPLDVPDLWRYTGLTDYNGNLLLWGTDTHLSDHPKILLCLLDAETGSILAENEVEVEAALYYGPQPLGEALYLCDSSGGQVLELDETLQVCQQWQVQPNEGEWYMGGGNTLYQLVDCRSILAVDLQTGRSQPLLDNAADLISYGLLDTAVSLEYSDPDEGNRICAVLDLTDGTLETPPFEGNFSTIQRAGDLWLGNQYFDGSVYDLGSGAQTMRVKTQDSTLQLLDNGYILESACDNQWMNLYNSQGDYLSGCRLSDNGEYYPTHDLIWNEALGGCFFLLENSGGGRQLMFWDFSKDSAGDPLALEAVPPVSEQLNALRQQAARLGQQYGVEILVAEQCQTDFLSFTAQLAEDTTAISMGLDHLEAALKCYPEGFFRQLRFYDVQGIQIHLVGSLESARPGSYAAFAYAGGEQFIVVCDIFTSSSQTYFHEFSHIIDMYLDWDGETRQESAYSEDSWMALNPEGFEYSNDYATEFDPLPAQYSTYFVGSYSTINPTEDRAQVMEYAMTDYGEWMFEENPGLYEKLRCYCEYIRDAFDTTGWPETTVWEQYLE